jgi:hypothetical protein
MVKDFTDEDRAGSGRPPKLRGDLAGIAQALVEFAQREFAQRKNGLRISELRCDQSP